MRIGILIRFFVVLLIGSSVEGNFRDMWNGIRSEVAKRENISDMYELVDDQKLCEREKKRNGTGYFEVFRYIIFDVDVFEEDYFKQQTDDFLDKNGTEQYEILKNGQQTYILPVEYIVPEQRRVCCDTYDRKQTICLFGDEGTLRSWVNKSKGIPGTGCDPGYKNFTGLCRKDSKTPDSIEKPSEIIQVTLDIDTLEMMTTVPVTSTKEETLKPPIASTSDLSSSPNNSSIIHVTGSSEVTRIPLVYLRPTENPDLEKRLKKYLAEETDGDEPDDGDPLNEYEYYDYDSSSSISILVTVVFVCFFVFV